MAQQSFFPTRKEAVTYLNTSYVLVQLPNLKAIGDAVSDLNTSYVPVQQKEAAEKAKLDANLNTSYVSVQRSSMEALRDPHRI